MTCKALCSTGMLKCHALQDTGVNHFYRGVLLSFYAYKKKILRTYRSVESGHLGSIKIVFTINKKTVPCQ